jgi:putative holliday junction resolvase
VRRRLTRGPEAPLSAPSVYAGFVRVLGIDYGRRRIGLAISDATGLLARPWKTIANSGTHTDIANVLASEIQRLREEGDGLEAVVLGLPRRLGGEPNEQTNEVKALAADLEPVIGVALVLQDERLTSREADGLLARSEKDWRKRKASLDATAAAIILQDYLDSRATATGEWGDRQS